MVFLSRIGKIRKEKLMEGKDQIHILKSPITEGILAQIKLNDFGNMFRTEPIKMGFVMKIGLPF